ncbi:MAG: SAM-dependent chlorinase/fluorinase, partial [Desulfobulbaceae bacterium]|nr:SAM-dependent chlorinase/fluorinase [Desulfobulbaceae bacterium]
MNKKNSSRVNCITLTTDFGVTDEYVGVMKGVIRSIAPDVPVIDITHAIGPQNIRHGAYIIHAAFAYFPENSLHMIIVDPGVGSDRRIILARISGHLFLAPDNGILSLLLEKETYEAAYEVTCDHLFLSPLSNTFHGRDIFAPVAAHLTGSIAPHEVG